MANYRVNLKYNTQRDAELIRRLEAQENKQDYIRRLIMSDIAADSLRGILTLDEMEQGREYAHARIKFWEDNCPASVDPGEEDPCSTCKYYGSAGACTLDAEWEKVKQNGKV